MEYSELSSHNMYITKLQMIWHIGKLRMWWWEVGMDNKYRKIYNIRGTESPNLNDSRLVVQLSLPNPMKPGVKSRMKM